MCGLPVTRQLKSSQGQPGPHTNGRPACLRRHLFRWLRTNASEQGTGMWKKWKNAAGTQSSVNWIQRAMMINLTVKTDCRIKINCPITGNVATITGKSWRLWWICAWKWKERMQSRKNGIMQSYQNRPLWQQLPRHCLCVQTNAQSSTYFPPYPQLAGRFTVPTIDQPSTLCSTFRLVTYHLGAPGLACAPPTLGASSRDRSPRSAFRPPFDRSPEPPN